MSETQTQTLAALATHPERGWPVDPSTGKVFSVLGKWKGHEVGRVGDRGYLVTSYRGRKFYMHRVVWEACVGPIPPGLVINHKNGVKTDNRLDNLEVVTQSENNLHAHRSGLRTRAGAVEGPRNWNYSLTPAMHHEILRRVATGERFKAIADAFGVSTATVYRIRKGLRCPN